jgi:hypothetical protein
MGDSKVTWLDYHIYALGVCTGIYWFSSSDFWIGVAVTYIVVSLIVSIGLYVRAWRNRNV